MFGMTIPAADSPAADLRTSTVEIMKGGGDQRRDSANCATQSYQLYSIIIIIIL